MKMFKAAVLKWSAVVASLALLVATTSTTQVCWFWFHQPKVPQVMEKFKK